MEAKIFASLAGRDDAPASRPPPGHVVSPTPPADELPKRDGEALGDNNCHEQQAFLRRGTSSSSSLFPRPAAPSTDSLESLLPFGMTKPNPSSKIKEALQGSGGGENSSPLERDGSSETSRSPRASERKRAEVLPDARGKDLACTVVRQCRATVVLSDMAPSFSGDHDMDQARVAGLILDALAACLGDEGRRTGALKRAGGGSSRDAGKHSCDLKDGRLFSTGDELAETEEEATEEEMRASGSGADIGLLARGGAFLGKFFAGRDEREVKEEAEKLFRTVKVVKPPASRSGSSEMYLLATGFLLGHKRR